MHRVFIFAAGTISLISGLVLLADVGVRISEMQRAIGGIAIIVGIVVIGLAIFGKSKHIE